MEAQRAGAPLEPLELPSVVGSRGRARLSCCRTGPRPSQLAFTPTLPSRRGAPSCWTLLRLLAD
jgi:hypothetical protein